MMWTSLTGLQKESNRNPRWSGDPSAGRPPVLRSSGTACMHLKCSSASWAAGAVSVNVSGDRKGYVCHVVYGDGRRGIVELTYGSYRYGGVIRDDREKEVLFQVSYRVPFYQMLIIEIIKFFKGESQVIPLEDSFEVMAMLSGGRTVPPRQAGPNPYMSNKTGSNS